MPKLPESRRDRFSYSGAPIIMSFGSYAQHVLPALPIAEQEAPPVAEQEESAEEPALNRKRKPDAPCDDPSLVYDSPLCVAHLAADLGLGMPPLSLPPANLPVSDEIRVTVDATSEIVHQQHRLWQSKTMAALTDDADNNVSRTVQKEDRTPTFVAREPGRCGIRPCCYVLSCV